MSNRSYQSRVSANPAPSASVLVQFVSASDSAVATGTVAWVFDDTIPQNTEGDQFMSKAITPKNANNTLLIEAILCMSSDTALESIGVALFQDTTADALAAMYNHGSATAASNHIITLRHVMTAGTIVSTEFKIRAGVQAAGILTFNGASGARTMGGVMGSILTIAELSS